MTAIRNKSIKPGNVIGQRLKYEMKSRGVSSTELALRADVKTSFIYDVISGKSTNPSTVKLARVAEGLGITLASLLAPEEQGRLPEMPLRPEDYVAIPVLSPDAAGGLLPGETPFCYLHAWIVQQLGSRVGDLRVFTVTGDNMEPTLAHNDVVLVDVARANPAQPGIYVLSDGYGLSLRRVERVMTAPGQQRVRIVSDNPQYSIYETSPAEAGIIGRVVWFSRTI